MSLATREDGLAVSVEKVVQLLPLALDDRAGPRRPDATAFLSAYCANSFSTFEPGQVKHSIQTNEVGKLVGEGVLYRLGDGGYRYTGGGAYWLDHWLRAGDWDAVGALDTPEEFVFAIQGPRSIDVLGYRPHHMCAGQSRRRCIRDRDGDRDADPARHGN